MAKEQVIALIFQTSLAKIGQGVLLFGRRKKPTAIFDLICQKQQLLPLLDTFLLSIYTM